MVSKTKLKEINTYLENEYIPAELNYNKECFNIDWSKLDYNIKEKPKHQFDIYFENLVSMLNKTTIVDDDTIK